MMEETTSDQPKYPSSPTMLSAAAIAAGLLSFLETVFQYWLTPLGWSSGMLVALFLMVSFSNFVGSTAMGLILGLPLARLLIRKGQFQLAPLLAAGAALGMLFAVLASAAGSTYHLMTGSAFWRSLVSDAAMGSLTAFFWWKIEGRRSRSA